jgi:zinc transport system substrate-binding protein
MFKRKIGIYALTFAMAAMGMTGCSSGSSSGNQTEGTTQSAKKASSESFSVVCTIFPEYDWVKEILGDHADNVELTYLLDNGVDLHSYQPTADDMMKISTCDLFVYVGGESDKWADDALADTQNKDMKVINLMDVLGDSAKEEELKEGMQGEEEEEEPEYDEHVWLSLKNAKILCSEIETNLEAIDSANAADYKANLDSYTAKLDELDGKFQTLVEGSSVKTLVFGDRFPFRYFVDDYGLDYYAAFIGCSAETEASFETIAFLSDKVNELDCKTIFTLENSSKNIANTIISTSGKTLDIAELNSLQSVSKDDIAGGASYISLMQKNYDVLAGVLK